jgi:hypothetical protein
VVPAPLILFVEKRRIPRQTRDQIQHVALLFLLGAGLEEAIEHEAGMPLTIGCQRGQQFAQRLRDGDVFQDLLLAQARWLYLARTNWSRSRRRGLARHGSTHVSGCGASLVRGGDELDLHPDLHLFGFQPEKRAITEEMIDPSGIANVTRSISPMHYLASGHGSVSLPIG